MAAPTKSVLLLDYDSLQRSLAGAIGETRLGDRAAAWIAAIENGRLIGPDGVQRHLLVKRCYAGSGTRGRQRDVLTAAGFDVIDAADGSSRSSADLHMAMDTIDALARPEGYEEFILLSAASELTPLLTRLKAHKRRTAIFADQSTSAGDKSLADTMLDSGDFVRFLTSEETPVAEIRAPTAPTGRAEIEAFARKIHAATSIPLFSPKAFAELFRHLTDEIAENGYHFQTTAKNVADRMVASGRNVTRRQVVFIVKGLALKGHVFSTTDTPERLAEVFREQAAYLITNAGISLDEHQQQLLSAWFMSRAPASSNLAPLGNQAADLPEATKSEIEESIEREVARAVTRPTEVDAEAKSEIEETIEREVAKALIRPPAPEKAAPPPRPAKPPAVKVEMPKSAAKTPQARPGPSPSAREEAKAVIAARIAASAKLRPGSRTPLPAKAAPKLPVEPNPPAEIEAESALPPPEPVVEVTSEAEGPQEGLTQPNSEALENSILAAIAEAVDVLVEDTNGETPPPREAPKKKPAPLRQEPPPRRESPRRVERPTAPDDGDGSDIGDQIQRIIASYNRNRNEE